MEREVLEIKALIERLRGVDTEFRVFGANGHRYRFGPTLSADEISDFEKKHCVVLPEDFRCYLQIAGDGNGKPWKAGTGPWERGGAGPGYGIYPLAETAEGLLKQPFPWEEEVDLPYEPPYDAWDGETPGALEICTAGCSSHTHLIVDGPTYGTVWEGYDHDHYSPTKLSFCQWMRRWVERELDVFSRKPLVELLHVGMTKEDVLSATGPEWTERPIDSSTEVSTATAYFYNALMRVQLKLDGNGKVLSINSYY